ncbi:MAG TPA: hypothetical protein VNN72_08195 [Polyangiaceae bacterium]|nr:hypothetical protein [Polyangiaceae bacterium]
MGGSGTAWIVGTVALALSATIGCHSSKSSDDDDAGQGSSAGHSAGGTPSQGGSSGSSGGAGTAGQAGSAAGTGGSSGSGGASGSSGAGAGGAGGTAGSGGRAGDSGGNATGGISGNAGAAGESAGGSGGGSAGRGGSPASVDCSGTFGEPRLVFEPHAQQLFSPTLTADELELIYAVGDGSNLEYFHSKRSSKAEDFEPGPGEPLPELDAACVTTDSRTIDLTSDGLRAYLVCYGSDNPESHTLRVAARPTLGAPFVLDPKSYGSVGPSAGIAPDELTLYSSAVRPGQDPALAFERASTSEPFGDGMPIPGLEEVLLLTPDVSADGLSLFGSVDGAIVVATRSTTHDAFSIADPIIAPPDSGEWISATISEDCRSLYAVRQTPGVTLEVFER